MGEQPTISARRSLRAFNLFMWWTYIFVLPILGAMIYRFGAILHVYSDRLVLVRGILSKRRREIFFSDIRSADVDQGLIDRIVGVGRLGIATAGTSGYEIVVSNLVEAEAISGMITRARHGVDAPTATPAEAAPMSTAAAMAPVESRPMGRGRTVALRTARLAGIIVGSVIILFIAMVVLSSIAMRSMSTGG